MEGIGIGIGIGFGGGFASGMAAGMASGREKLQKQLRKAVEDNEISIHDKNGEPLTIEALFALLDKNYKKVWLCKNNLVILSRIRTYANLYSVTKLIVQDPKRRNELHDYEPNAAQNKQTA